MICLDTRTASGPFGGDLRRQFHRALQRRAIDHPVDHPELIGTLGGDELASQCQFHRHALGDLVG